MYSLIDSIMCFGSRFVDWRRDVVNTVIVGKRFQTIACEQAQHSDWARIILGDPGEVSRAERKGATKVFKHRRKSPWVPTLAGPFSNFQANAGS